MHLRKIFLDKARVYAIRNPLINMIRNKILKKVVVKILISLKTTNI